MAAIRGWTAAASKLYLPARFAPLTGESAAAIALALGPGFIDVQSTSFELRSVQTGDGLIRFLRITHFDERESTGAAGIAVGHNIDTINGSIPLEHRTNRRIGSGKIQIAYKNVFH